MRNLQRFSSWLMPRAGAAARVSSPSDSTPCGTLRARVPAALRAPCAELPEASAERLRECLLPYSGSLLLPLFLFFVFSI